MKKPLLIPVLALMVISAAAQTARPKSSSVPALHANVYPLQEGFVDAHGVLIYYQIVGRGQPLMILHGGPGASHDYFLPYLLPLARTNKIISLTSAVQAVQKNWKM